MLVLLAVTVAVILALSFQSAQSTTLPIAQNINRHATARHVAESAMAMAITHVKTSDTWRDDFAAGRLPTNQTFAAGTFTLTVEDGQDLDGDGVISTPAEGDGNLTDDPNDLVTLAVIGRMSNVTHTLRAVIDAFEDPGNRMKLLLVVDDATAMTGADNARINQFEDWNFEVIKISDHASQGDFNAGIENADVAYISNSAKSSEIKNKMDTAAIGIVSEVGGMGSEWKLVSTAGLTPETRISVTNNTHEITQPLALGTHDVHTASEDLNRFIMPTGSGGEVLATPYGSLQASLVAFEAGTTTTTGGATVGRRVLLPVGGGTFHFGKLAGDGKTIVYRSLIWASKAPKGPPAVAHWRLDESTGITAHDSSGTNHGTAFDGTSWTAGRLLNGHDFDGLNDYVQIPDAPELRPTTAISVCAWVMGGSWSTNDSVDLILRKGEGNPNNWQLSITNGKVALSLDAHDGQNGSGNVYGNTVLQINRWYHVAATWDGTTARIYVDGVVDNGSGKNYTSTLGTDTRPVYIGGRAGGDAHDRFQGILDDIRLYNRALSGAEIRVIMNEAVAADANAAPQIMALYNFIEVKPDPQLVAYWKLDDTTTDGGGLAANDKVDLLGKGRIDSYRSTQGPYDRTKPGRAAIVATNSTSSGRFHFENPTSLWGDAFCGVGGTPSSVIDAEVHNISGRKLALGSSVSIPGQSAPTGMPSSQGNKTFSSSATWSSNQNFSSLTISSSAIITINGNIRVHSSGAFTLKDSAKIVLNPGSTLKLYVGGSAAVSNTAQLNPATNRAGDVEIITYAGTFTLSNSSIASAIVRSDDDLIVQNTAEFYGGAICADDMTITDEAQVHLDLSLPSLGVAQPPAHDDTDTNDGRIFGGASGGLIGGLIGGLVGVVTDTVTSLGLDGTDDRVEIQHHDDYLLTDGAIAFFFKTTKSSTKQGLFSKDSSGNDTGGQTTLWWEGGKVFAKLESTSATYTIQSASLTTNTWHHVAFTFGQGGMKLYINGTLAATNSYTGGLGNPVTRTGNFEPILLGASTESSGNLTTTGWNYPLSGGLDDVRIYDYVLDATQVSNLRNGAAIGPSSLPGAVVRDASSYGSPSNMPIPDVTKITWLPGGGLTINSNQPLKSLVNATKIHQGVLRTKQVTIEADFTPSSDAMGATGTVFGFGGTGARNLALEQQSGAWVAAIKAGSTVRTVNSGNVLSSGAREHMVVCYDGENITRYRNGQFIDATPVTGDFASWVSSNPLTIAGEADNSRPWTGTLNKVAIYDRAFNKTQAKNVFNGLPPGNGASNGTGAVRFIEQP